MKDAECGTCVYVDSNDPEYCECRFNPPVVFFDKDIGNYVSVWPMVQKYEWCGKYMEEGVL